MDYQKLSSVLMELNEEFLAINASAILTSHGTMLADTFSLNGKKDDLAALISAMNIHAAGTTKSLDCGESLELFIHCAQESLIITEVFGGLLLAILVNSDDLFEQDLLAIQMFLSTKRNFANDVNLLAA